MATTLTLQPLPLLDPKSIVDVGDLNNPLHPTHPTGHTKNLQEDMDTNHTQAQKRKTPHTSSDTRGRHYPSGAVSGATLKQPRQSSFHTSTSKDKTPMTPRPSHNTAQSHIDHFVVSPT